ncbi:MAG TPA: hypothetical protein VFV22_02675 [Candidatus Paceibacterota bacterium]|nr:hypothetical protein [Candidatus Paceibacterota bacterium]
MSATDTDVETIKNYTTRSIYDKSNYVAHCNSIIDSCGVLWTTDFGKIDPWGHHGIITEYLT